MENKLLKKLQIKPGFKIAVINAPANLGEIIGDIPQEITLSAELDSYNALLLFAINKVDMVTALTSESSKINNQTIFWIIYPKVKTNLAGDLNLMQSWDELKNYQLTPCASAAINEIWTAIRVKPESATKRSGVGNAEIKNNEYGEFIDVENRIITIPPIILETLANHSTALANLEKLSYTNKKEYVLWILSAKQEQTKTTRLEKMVTLLLAGKKNPSEK
jgi:hypothetical protein